MIAATQRAFVDLAWSSNRHRPSIFWRGVGMQAQVFSSIDERAQHHRQHPERTDRREAANDLFRRAARAKGHERQRLIDEIVLLHLGLAESVARRYSNRGIERDDLVQVANLGLVNAAQRFDPDLGKDFVSFAMPTITGEVKRYFRDHGWAVRPPRRVQELHAALRVATAQLSQSLGAAPTHAELAEHLGVDVEEIREATASHECFTTASIDYRGGDGDETPMADSLGEEERGFARADAVVMLAPLCRELPQRDRRILYLRFFRGWTQQEIAQELGVTQMQVSRLLARILGALRSGLGAPEPDRPTRRRRA
ncbi:SigB/SigF/SigG family RNA polymerase sigma factor [Jiangella asiatica]|uniref:SigB/SigF/SigG family RNA polymerase sigma factor n=1 Tax=Jiangella asiatica TaxID=2530372 RepID=A0A4R5DRJ3_9ACTN|nr:SigB/SigF/SigG family RNA polymerase sigma factor [Jiangella asiatica]TDE14924.1 SigB/SigF/SigG family RNA polymerase sigma factor [Jiangella asiatica]